MLSKQGEKFAVWLLHCRSVFFFPLFLYAKIRFGKVQYNNTMSYNSRTIVVDLRHRFTIIRGLSGKFVDTLAIRKSKALLKKCFA